MKLPSAAILLGFAAGALSLCAAENPLARPKAGKTEIMPVSQIKPGMKGIAWTVFQGTEPEPVPIEIIGRWKDMWGPKQDVIIAKMGGKAVRTNVAGGMSGSPVYIDGKLVGAVALRLSTFSPDAICGITPIELMLEINGSEVRLVSRNRNRFKHLDPLAATLAERLRVNNAVLDGEVICADGLRANIYRPIASKGNRRVSSPLTSCGWMARICGRCLLFIGSGDSSGYCRGAPTI